MMEQLSAGEVIVLMVAVSMCFFLIEELTGDNAVYRVDIVRQERTQVW